MANNNNSNPRTQTSTQIRNMYSDSMSYMNIKFYNTSLAFQLYPFTNKDNNGRSNYDMNNSLSTTVPYDSAFALYDACNSIIDGKTQELNLTIPCFNAELTLSRKKNQNGDYETILSISKNDMTIPFRFHTMTMDVVENGQHREKVIEVGLGNFMKTLDGYLSGVNADRHLDKLTEDYIKSMQAQNSRNARQFNAPNPYNGPRKQYQPGPNNQNFQNNNNGNNRYGGNGGNNGGYRNNGPKQNSWGPSQNFNNYNVPN